MLDGGEALGPIPVRGRLKNLKLYERTVKQLVGIIGRKITAYVGGVRDVRAVDRWMNGSELYGAAEQGHLRAAAIMTCGGQDISIQMLRW